MQSQIFSIFILTRFSPHTDDEIFDRNCSCCERCCMDYDGWLQFQQSLYRIVRDPLFELAITICIILNTMFLAMEHHGMSQSVLRALDIGNKVSKFVYHHVLFCSRRTGIIMKFSTVI